MQSLFCTSVRPWQTDGMSCFVCDWGFRYTWVLDESCYTIWFHFGKKNVSVHMRPRWSLLSFVVSDCVNKREAFLTDKIRVIFTTVTARWLPGLTNSRTRCHRNSPASVFFVLLNLRLTSNSLVSPRIRFAFFLSNMSAMQVNKQTHTLRIIVTFKWDLLLFSVDGCHLSSKSP